jgi:hypothetical protein
MLFWVRTEIKEFEMKKIILFVSLFIGLAFSNEANADTWVNGYFRSDGTYVPGHYRSDRNDTTLDNWSTYPNYNPYTLEQGTKRVPLYEPLPTLQEPKYTFVVKDGTIYKCYEYYCTPVRALY